MTLLEGGLISAVLGQAANLTPCSLRCLSLPYPRGISWFSSDPFPPGFWKLVSVVPFNPTPGLGNSEKLAALVGLPVVLQGVLADPLRVSWNFENKSLSF